MGENVIGHGQQQQILAVGENAPQIDFDGKGILFVIRVLKKRIRNADSMSGYKFPIKIRVICAKITLNKHSNF